MLDPNIQKALDNLQTFEIKPLSTDQLNGLTTVDLSTLKTVSITPQGAAGYGGSPGAGYTLASGTASSINWQAPNVWTTTSAVGATIGGGPAAGQLALNGEKADININGKSMSDWMEKVEERLNILTPNTELEKDWDDLRKLGERYRRLEKKCKEKAETWKKLKAMPPPQVD